jgi:P4 family phage/plasmid primase-like protien
MTTQPELKAAAEVYHELGMSIIPFYINEQADANGVHEKKPRIDAYAKWQTTPQTDEEFKALDWSGCNGFGILLGKQTKDNRYLAVIDYDTKNNKKTPEEREAYQKAVTKGKEIFDAFPTTTKEKTVNEGLHKLYWSKVKPKTDGSYHDTAALELLGENKLCVMRPSYGYSNIGSDVITEVESLEETFYSILKQHGFSRNEESEFQNQQDAYSFEIGKIVDLSKLTKQANGYEYQGPHPIHDSTTEHNFCVNIKTGTWFCFRHNSGGGVLQYLAMREGIIKCEQAKKGALRGKKFHDTLELAVANHLLDEKVLTQSEINPVILAKDIMGDYVFVVEKETNELFFYDATEGIYSNATEQLIKREIAIRLDENFKSRYYTEIKEFIIGIAPLVKMDSASPEILPIKNGLLNTLTKELTEYTPEAYVTNKLTEVTLNPTELIHVWRDFLDQVLPNKTQQKQLQQLIGHCLYKKIVTETCPILLGKGANGKTIVLLTITKFLGGSKNVSSHSIQQLCYDKFTTGEIKGKIANICADLPHKEILNTAIFKALMSGDSVQAYIKHVQKTGSFTPTCKYIFSANQTPPVSTEEDCFAWYRRFVFMDFNVTFTGEKAKPRQELLDSLSTPAVFSEILNWALDGLAELIKDGDITDRPTVEQIRLQYIRRSDTALAYFEDKVTITDDSSDYVFVDWWFRDYVTYCHINKLKAKTQGEFINTVKQHLPGAEKTRIRPDYEKGELKPNPLAAWRYVKVVPSVPSVPTSKNKRPKTKKNTLDKFPVLDGLVQKASTSDTPDTQKPKQDPEKSAAPGDSQTKPTWYAKDIPAGEKCDCGKAPVTKEILTPQGDTLKRCEECLKKMRLQFSEAVWKPGYPDMQSYDGEIVP